MIKRSRGPRAPLPCVAAGGVCADLLALEKANNVMLTASFWSKRLADDLPGLGLDPAAQAGAPAPARCFQNSHNDPPSRPRVSRHDLLPDSITSNPREVCWNTNRGRKNEGCCAAGLARLFRGATSERSRPCCPASARRPGVLRAERILRAGGAHDIWDWCSPGGVLVEHTDMQGAVTLLGRAEPGSCLRPYACAPDELLLVDVVAGSEAREVLFLDAKSAS